MEINTFPEFKVDEILAFLQNDVLDGPDARSILKSNIVPNPKPDLIRRLYMRILQIVFGFRPDSNHMVPVNEHIQYPVLLEGFLPICNIYLRMSQFLPLCLVHDFQMSDLLNPKAKRTIFILSGIINFLKFRNFRREIYLEHLQSYKSAGEESQYIVKGIKEAELKIVRLTTIPPEQQAEFNKLSSDILDLQNAMSQESQRVVSVQADSISQPASASKKLGRPLTGREATKRSDTELSATANAVNEQIAQRKCEHSEVTQMLSKKKVDLATLKEDHIKLESLIVESPEELRNEKEKLKETVKKIKQSIDNKNVVLVELQNKKQTSSLCHGTFESFYKLLEDLQGLVEKINVLQTEIHDLTDGIERQRKDLKNMSTDETQYKRAVGMKMDKKTKLQIRRQKKQEMKDQQVQIVFSECNQVQEKREDILKHMKQIDCETQQIRATIQLLTETCTHETEKAQAMHDRLMTVLDQYHERLARLAENGTGIE